MSNIVFTKSPYLAALGGFFVTRASDLPQLLSAEEMKQSIPEETYVIVVSAHMPESLSYEHYNALIAHEEGHIYHDHIAKAIAGGATGEDGPYVNECTEIEADDFAVSKVGKEVFKEALKKCVEVTTPYAMAYLEIPVSDKEQFHQSYLEAMSPRINRL